jgi:hypothetical protein
VKTAYRAGRAPILDGSDMHVIGQGPTTLPGNWYLDPVVDLKRWGKPKMWVRRVGFITAGTLAVSFERLGASIWVAFYSANLNQDVLPAGLPFDTLPAALVYLWARLAAELPDVGASQGSAGFLAPVEAVPTSA